MENDTVDDKLREILAHLTALRGASDKDKPPVIPLIDPTSNVLSLVTAAIARQDDLRAFESRRQDELRKMESRCNQEISEAKEQAQRDLSAAESRRIDALSLAESRRIDAVLSEQKAAALLANEKATAQAAALTQSVVTSAESLRNQATASTAATTEAIRVLERAQYQISGAGEQRKEARGNTNWIVGVLVSAGLAVAGMFLGAAYFAANMLAR